MTLMRIELNDGQRPLDHIWIGRCAAHFEMKPFYLIEYITRIAVAIRRPVFELPLFALREHRNHSIPIMTLQLINIINYFKLLRRAILSSMHDNLAILRRVLVLKRFSLFFRPYISFLSINSN